MYIKRTSYLRSNKDSFVYYNLQNSMKEMNLLLFLFLSHFTSSPSHCLYSFLEKKFLILFSLLSLVIRLKIFLWCSHFPASTSTANTIPAVALPWCLFAFRFLSCIKLLSLSCYLLLLFIYLIFIHFSYCNEQQ